MGWTWPWQKWKPKISGVISGNLLQQKIFQKYHVMPITNDVDYRIPADPGDVLWQCSPRGLKYFPESRDCDDYVRIARGWLSLEALGDLLVMDCALRIPGGSAHAVLAFLDGDELVFGEPQTGRMWTPPDGAKVYRLIA